jgi:hypothetical protein
MDYLQEDLSFERRRDYRINTSIPFILAVIGTWVALFCWIAIFAINCIRFARTKSLRV